MNEPAITPDVIASHGLTADEYQRIEQILGRAPNYTELGIFSVMWSEHCSYKSSRVHLRKFPTTGPRVIQGPGVKTLNGMSKTSAPSYGLSIAIVLITRGTLLSTSETRVGP